MQLRHLTVTMNGNAQNLGTLAAAKWGDQALGAGVCMLELQPAGANNSPVYLAGFGPTVTSSEYGVRLEAGDSSDIPPAPYRLTSDGSYMGVGLIDMNAVNLIGANGEVLHVFALIPAPR
jgi:hypothetical protein